MSDVEVSRFVALVIQRINAAPYPKDVVAFEQEAMRRAAIKRRINALADTINSVDALPTWVRELAHLPANTPLPWKQLLNTLRDSIRRDAQNKT